MNCPTQRNSRSGYSLIELMIATGILATGAAAAAALSLVSISQEETSHRLSRAVNVYEGAIRLYQLGLSPSEIEAIIPPEPAVNEAGASNSWGITITDNGAAAMGGVGNPESATFQLNYEVAVTGDGSSTGSMAGQTPAILVYRTGVRPGTQ